MAQIIKSSTSDVTSEHPPMPATMPSPPSPPIANNSADFVKSATSVGEGIYNNLSSSYHSNMAAEEEENGHEDGFDDESS